MRKLIFAVLLTAGSAMAQVVKDYDPQIQRTSALQYFKPAESHLFTGDCMPYYHDGTFYVYWLLDEGHHSGLGGLGGHQWALSTSEDLVNWTHYSVAVGIERDWEKSICTGSVIADKDKFYAFYSTRVQDDQGVHEQLSYAVSDDGGKKFVKQQPNPFYFPPEECVSRDFRDPKVFRDEDGTYHLFISAYKKNPVIEGFGGYLYHMVSDDLKNWKESKAVLAGQVATPECSDYFKWNDWYYLLYSTGGDTYCVMSRNPFGPWQYPATQAFVEQWGCVYKTAPFKDGRRIAVAYMPCRSKGKDFDGAIWGGNMLLREVVQAPDGTLGTRFLEEVLPKMHSRPLSVFETAGDNATASVSDDETLIFNASDGTATASLSGLPVNYRLSFEFEPAGNYDEAGVFVRGTGKNDRGYKIELNSNKESAFIYNTGINTVKGLDKPVKVDIIMKDEFIDMNIDGRRSIINRLPEKKGDRLVFFLKNGNARFGNITLSEWAEEDWK